MKIRVLIKEDGFLQGYAVIGGMPDWLEVEVTEEIINDLNENYKKYYLKDNKLIKQSEKPSNFHIWDFEIDDWVYDKELELNSLEDELGNLEFRIYELEQEIKSLKETGKTFSLKKAVKLEEEVVELEKLYKEKLKRYEELEG